MKPFLVAFSAVLFLAGCTQLATTTSGRVSTPNTAKADVFSLVVDAMLESGLDVVNVNEGTGLIMATSPTNPLLAERKKINVTVRVAAAESRTEINIKATLGGQFTAYGATRNIVEDLHKRLKKSLPGSDFYIDGKRVRP